MRRWREPCWLGDRGDMAWWSMLNRLVHMSMQMFINLALGGLNTTPSGESIVIRL